MKKLYHASTFFIICILAFSQVNAQQNAEPNIVEGSIWINPHLRSSEIDSEKVPVFIEKIAEKNYRLCSQVGEVNLFTMMAFEKTCQSELPCELSFNENCEAICNSDCSYINAMTGNPERLPIATFDSPDFPNNACFQKINNTHWYALKTLQFAESVLNFNDIGIGNTQTVYARYSPVGHWGNSSADDFGVTMNTNAANSPDAICHEWGHYLNNRITKGNIIENNQHIETQSIDEGLGDVWSSLVRLYLEENENLENFKAATPDYRMWAVNRNFATTYKPYNTCAVLGNDLPSAVQSQAWIGGDSHTKGLTLSHWFYLLSEGTNGKQHNITIEIPENESTLLTYSLCSNPSFAKKERTLQFEIEGIGHWKSLQILYKALSIIGEDDDFSSLTFPKFRCATEQAVEALFPNDCHVLQQLSTAWYALNVGEKYKLDISTQLQFCEGDNWSFSLQNEAVSNIEVYAPNGELVVDGSNSVNFEIESVIIENQGIYQVKYRLDENCKGALSESCEWSENMEVFVNVLPKLKSEIPNQAVCKLETLHFDAREFIEAESYEWTNENGDILANTAELSFEANNSTNLILKGSNDCGTQELSASIEVYELPEQTDIMLQSDECQSSEVMLWVDDLYESYVWNGVEGGENSLIITEGGWYELEVVNEQGCQASMSIEVGEEAFPTESFAVESNHVLLNDEVWTIEKRQVYGKLFIPSGRTLEMEGIEVEFMNEASGIVVEKGGILKVNNSVLKGNGCEERVWKGILVKGDAYKTQEQLQYQGQLELKNSTIRDAYIGVEMGEGYSSSFLATGGGVLKAENTKFLDNSIGVLFHAYLNESESQISNDCSFVFSNVFKSVHHLGEVGYVGILAINIGGIEVQNSYFKNEQNSEWLEKETDRGTAIVSWHAPMQIGTGDESGQNHFVNLYKGINAYSTSSILGYMMIEGNRFEGVAKGIHLQNNHFSSIVGNRFEKMSDKNGYGLYAQKTEGITIANNVFEAANSASQSEPMWGMIVENAGYYGCTVYKNEFKKAGIDDRFFAAMQFEGENNLNTLIDCNRFEAVSNYDVLLLNDSNRHFAEEGGCDEFDPLISPLKNEWHTLCDNVETYHLYHDNADAPLHWTFMPGFEPNCYSNNLQPIVCEDDDNDCSLGGFGQLNGKDESDILESIETAITPKEHSLAISQLVRYHLKTNELSTAIRTLQQDKQNLPNRVLTRVFEGKENEDNSLKVFNRTLLKEEALPQKFDSEQKVRNDELPKPSKIYTHSSLNRQIRTANTDMIVENSHIKVKFKHSVNPFLGMDVAVILVDMNGRVLHHQQIEGGDIEYLIDRKLIMHEKYICSLWVNGNLVKSRKFLVSN